ncbi:MAG: sigma-54 dependent transcriptional regulator [Myxococcota bacterium]
MATILVVDDDAGIRFALGQILERRGHSVVACAGARTALPRLGDVQLVITDLAMPEMDGLEFLQSVRREHPRTPVILLTAFGSERIAVNAIKAGAFDYVAKPFDKDDLVARVDRALGQVALERENRALRAERATGKRFVAESPAMRRLIDAVDRIADRDVTVLLRGETGTGKELIASLIHAGSARRERPLVRFNCAALPGELADAELFGHTKGAFTGAGAARAGYFEKANESTLVLDEVGELTLPIQAKLLRAVQQGEVQRVGASGPERVDVRLVASTNRDLLAEANAGRFRSDLYYRLAVVELVVPPLRERREDIAPLARLFATAYAVRFDLDSDRLPAALVAALEDHPWPGNVRQLENTIARLAALSRGTFDAADAARILEPDPDGSLSPSSREAGLRAEVEAFEKQLLVRALADAEGNMSAAARQLKIGRATLFDKLQKYELDPRGRRREQDV